MELQVKRLYEEAANLHQQAKSIMDAFAGKAMPTDKVTEVDTLLDQVEAKTNEAKRLERLAAQGEVLNHPANRLPAPGAPDAKGGERTESQKAFTKYLTGGKSVLLPDERKALRADDDAAGGFLTAPQTFSQNLLKFVDDLVVFRQLATVEQIGAAESLGVVSLDTDLSDYDWTTEIQTGNEDTVKPLGKRSLTPHPLAKRIKVSNTLIRKATRPVDDLVRDRLGYKAGVTMEKAYMSGTGAQQPLGVFVASNDGIPTSRDVTCASTTAFTADELIDLKFSLKAPYQASPTTRWLFHRDFLKRVRKLKDNNQQYLWAPGLAGGMPSTVLDVPYVQSEFAPNTFTTGLYIAVLGDIRFYWIVDSLALQIQVLNELYAETNQRGYIARLETDGQPVLAEAFARMKLA